MKQQIQQSVITCKCGTSFSSVLGNVTALARDYMQRIFPKGYIKTVYVDTKDISGELEDVDVVRKDKPILSIRPRFSFDAENTIMGRLPDWQYKNYYIFKQPSMHYIPVFGDEENEMFIYSIPERLKISFDISITFSTRMEAINAGYYFRGSVLQKSYFYLNDVFLETEIPKSMIAAIANKLELDMTDANDKTELIDYLNNHSLNRIQRKTKLSSGIEQYFYKYKVNVLSNFPDYPEVDDGESNGQISSDFKLTTTLDMEFTCPFNYIFESGKTIKISELDDEEAKALLEDKFVISETLPNPPVIEKKEEKEDGKKEHKKLVLWEGYITDSDIIDVLDLSPVIFEALGLVIDYCLDEKNDVKITEVFETVLFKGKYKIDSTDYKFEWSTREVINMKPIKDETYHFGIYMNTKKANEILESLDRRELYIEKELKIDR